MVSVWIPYGESKASCQFPYGFPTDSTMPLYSVSREFLVIPYGLLAESVY